MKWIGIRTEKVEGVSCTCVNSRYGELIIQINPESMIYVLNYVDGNGELAEPGEAGTVISWEQQYEMCIRDRICTPKIKKSRSSQ